jgi:hypothetical protein
MQNEGPGYVLHLIVAGLAASSTLDNLSAT